MRHISLKIRGSKTLWILLIILSGISILSVATSVGYTAVAHGHAPMVEGMKHIGIIVVAYVAAFVMSNIRYEVLHAAAGWLLLATIVMLVYVAFFTVKHRWIDIGINIQPSEIAKITLTIFIARELERKKETLDSWETFVMMLLYVAVVMGLEARGNLSTAILTGVATMLLMLFGGVNFKHWIIVAVMATVIGIAGLLYLSEHPEINIARSLTWGHRMDSFINEDHDALTQENMAKMAIARGELLGEGPGKTVHARLMTESENDFIYAIIIEEYGMVGGLIVLMIYGMMYFRCIMIARRCEGRRFATLLVIGIGTVIYIQALVNMGVAVGVLPVTGQTLPFISKGGSSYVILGCGIGIIQSVASDNKRREKEKKNEEAKGETAPEPKDEMRRPEPIIVG